VKAGNEGVIVAGSPVFFALQPRIAQWQGRPGCPQYRRGESLLWRAVS
jgi:hypothetical protein